MKVENGYIMSDEYEILCTCEEFLEKFLISSIAIRIGVQCLKRLKEREVVKCEND